MRMPIYFPDSIPEELQEVKQTIVYRRGPLHQGEHTILIWNAGYEGIMCEEVIAIAIGSSAEAGP